MIYHKENRKSAEFHATSNKRTSIITLICCVEKPFQLFLEVNAPIIVAITLCVGIHVSMLTKETIKCKP